MTRRLFIEDCGFKARIASVGHDAPPVPSQLFDRRDDIEVGGEPVEVYVEKPITSREVAVTLVDHYFEGFRGCDHIATPGSPYDIAKRWHQAGRP